METVKITDNILHVPVRQYRNLENSVTVIGAVHIGSNEFYDQQQKIINLHDRGFYEGISSIVNKDSIPQNRLKYLEIFPLCLDACL